MTATTDLVVEALRAEAQRRTRAALKAAADLEQQRTTSRRDVRAQAVKLVTFLAGAATLTAEADRLEALATDGTPTVAMHPDAPAAFERAAATLAADDDGLSPEAHLAAQRAGLEDAIPPGDLPEVEDELGTLPEDLTGGPDVDAAAILDHVEAELTATITARPLPGSTRPA